MASSHSTVARLKWNRKDRKKTFAPQSSSCCIAVRQASMAQVEAPTVKRGRLHNSHNKLIFVSCTSLTHIAVNLESGEKFMRYRPLLFSLL
jgi:hypothetical protein